MSIEDKKISTGPENLNADTDKRVIGEVGDVTRSESDAILHSVYSEQDVQKWEIGARKYRQFIEAVRREKRLCLRGENLGEIQALFLGEKPAVFGVTSVARSLEAELRQFGLESAGDYVYSPQAIQAVLQGSPADFEGLPIDSPQSFMTFLASQDMRTYALQRGLILGYPRAAIQQYEYEQTLQIKKLASSLLEIFGEGTKDWDFLVDSFFGNRTNKRAIESFFQEKLMQHANRLGIASGDLPRLMDELRYVLSAQSVNVHGVIWIDHEASDESSKKQQRLHAAFQRSGILGIASPQEA
jgi:hypothetical protein